MISEILNLLDILCSGIHYIEIALLLRESMFLSSMLNNTEVWYDVKRSEVESLEAMDLILLRKLLRAPVSTPKEAFYLELGIIPIRVLMKSRRILYLYYLLQRSPSEMLSQFFWQQWSAPVKGDWTVTVRQDLADFDMSADPEYLKSFSKYSFKKVVKEKAKDYAFKDLMKNKSSHSKLSKLSYTELTKQSYFELPEINIDEIRNLFKFRVRMHNFHENFRSNRDSHLCPLCNDHLDDQNDIASYKVIRDNFKGSVHVKTDNVYSSSVSVESVKIISNIISIREMCLEDMKKGK